MTKWTLRCVVLCGLVLASASLQAHHSLAGVYALGKEAKVSGEFKAFRFVNPHSSMKLEVKNTDGSATEWSFVGGSVTSIAKFGLKERTECAQPRRSNHGHVHAGGRRQESGWASGRDHLPGRAHGPLPRRRRVDGAVNTTRGTYRQGPPAKERLDEGRARVVFAIRRGVLARRAT